MKTGIKNGVFFDPIVVGDYTIRAPFHPQKTTANELIIEPKMSFGTDIIKPPI